jgi:hypothetical protein
LTQGPDTQERSVDDARQRVVAAYKLRANEAFKIAFGVFNGNMNGNMNTIHIAIHVFRGLLLQNVFNVSSTNIENIFRCLPLQLRVQSPPLGVRQADVPICILASRGVSRAGRR